MVLYFIFSVQKNIQHEPTYDVRVLRCRRPVRDVAGVERARGLLATIHSYSRVFEIAVTDPAHPLPYSFFFFNLRRMSGQNSFTTIVIVSYPTCEPHTLSVFPIFRSLLG